MTFLPSVVRAECRGGFRVHLTFNNLYERTVDFRPWLQGPVFEAPKDPPYLGELFTYSRHAVCVGAASPPP